LAGTSAQNQRLRTTSTGGRDHPSSWRDRNCTNPSARKRYYRRDVQLSGFRNRASGDIAAEASSPPDRANKRRGERVCDRHRIAFPSHSRSRNGRHTSRHELWTRYSNHLVPKRRRSRHSTVLRTATNVTLGARPPTFVLVGHLYCSMYLQIYLR